MKHYGSLPYTYQLIEGQIVGGRLALVVTIHETSVILTPNIGIILHLN